MSVYRSAFLSLAATVAFAATDLPAQEHASAAHHAPPAYETRAVHSPDGIGKFYMGREISRVMGAAGIPWLERSEREVEERPNEVLQALELRGGETVADLGAGSGYYTFRMARQVGPKGRVIAVDIQEEMLNAIRRRVTAEGAANIEVVQATASDPNLPENSVDLVLMVDVYHELEYPYEVMSRVYRALKPGGRVVLVEFGQEDPNVPIRELHKMSEAQLKKEMAAVGLSHVRTVRTLPWQHLFVARKR